MRIVALIVIAVLFAGCVQVNETGEQADDGQPLQEDPRPTNTTETDPVDPKPQETVVPPQQERVLWPGPCTDGAVPSETSLPELYVQTDDDVQRWTHDPASGEYVVRESYANNARAWAVDVSGDHVVAAWSDHLAVFDRALDVQAQKDGDFGGFDLRNDTIWMAGIGNLTSLDLDLRPKGSADFTLGSSKTSHDVLLCGSNAFLLDNVAFPVYVYQVDISDVQAPAVLDEVDVGPCSCHLDPQWFDADSERWRFMAGGGGYMAAYQRLHSYDVGGGGHTTTETFRSQESGGAMSSEGWAIHAVESLAEPVAIGWKDGQYHLGIIVGGDEGVSLEDTVLLKPSTRGHYIALDVQGELAAAYVMDTLYLVRLGSEPSILATQTFTDPVWVRDIAIGT